MLLFRSVVGKLWMTIIALVAVVLLINGLFLFNYIDRTFPDQSGSLQNLGDKIAKDAALHQNEESYFVAMNDLLKAEDAGMVLVDIAKTDPSQQTIPLGKENVPLISVFTLNDLKAIDQGKRVVKSFNSGSGSHREDFLILSIPTEGKDGTSMLSLILYQSKKSLETTQIYVKKSFIFVGIIGFILTTIFAFFLITRINRPLLELKKFTNFIIQGDYGKRVPVLSSDEIGELSNAFNLMGDQMEETIKDLNHEKENLSSVLRSMADAVISFDVEGQIIFTNPEGDKLLSDWSGIDWADSNEHSEQEEAALAARHIPSPLSDLFGKVVGETKEITSKIHVQNGVWSVIMAPLYSKDVVRGTVAVLRDVTEETRLEKLRKDFVANVSHELRTPLSMLQGYSEALMDDIVSTPEESKEMVQVIHDESLRMGRLVKDLLDLARMETGHIEFNFRPLDINQLLRRVHRKFSVLAKDNGIELDLQLLAGEVELQRADEDRLEQVLTNLLDNAFRHVPAGSQIIIRTQQSVLKNRNALLLEVEDHGQGIPPEDAPYVFERFYKADKARTRGTSGGTGLGLAIVKNIVEAHRGTIGLRSIVGQGTTFSLLLPVHS